MAPTHTPTSVKPASGRLAIFGTGISRILCCLMPPGFAGDVVRHGHGRGIGCRESQLRDQTIHGQADVVFQTVRPRFPMAFTSYYPQPFRYKNMADHGVHTYVVILTLTDKWLGGDKPVKGTPADYGEDRTPSITRLSRKASRKVLDADPQAIVLLRIFCDSPAWWDQVASPRKPTVAEKLGSQGTCASHSRPCGWRNDAAAALKNIVRFVSSSKFGRHVFGYMPTVGDTEEAAKGCDETSCAQKQFRKWLFERYGKG